MMSPEPGSRLGTRAPPNSTASTAGCSECLPAATRRRSAEPSPRPHPSSELGEQWKKLLETLRTFDQPVLVGVDHDLYAVSELELVEDAPDVALDCGFG